MPDEAEINKNHSLGSPRPAKKTKPKSAGLHWQAASQARTRAYLSKATRTVSRGSSDLQHRRLEGQRSLWSVHDRRNLSSIRKTLGIRQFRSLCRFRLAECKDSLYSPTRLMARHAVPFGTERTDGPRRLTMINKQGCSSVAEANDLRMPSVRFARQRRRAFFTSLRHPSTR
jgi:hypothetical protein